MKLAFLEPPAAMSAEGLARRQLGQHPLFHNRVATLRVESRGETLVVTGQLPSFYLKQMLQEVLKTVPGVYRVDNQVDVVNSSGLSSVRHSLLSQ